MATPAQKIAVALALVASALSFLSAAVRYSRFGEVGLTPIAGGLLMLVLGLAGLAKLRQPPA